VLCLHRFRISNRFPTTGLTTTILSTTVALALALTACSTITNNSTAATVNGVEISRATLEKFVNELSAAGQLEVADGVALGDDVRSILTAIIKSKNYVEFLKSVDFTITDEMRKVVEKSIDDPAVKLMSKELKAAIIDLNTATQAIQTMKSPSEQVIADLYNESPSLTGVMCISHIITKNKDTAVDVLNNLNNGADFATLAGKYSIEPNAKQSGGALRGSLETGETTPCMTLLDYQAGFDPLFTAGAIEAKAGVPFGPVESSFGFHVILAQPFDAVKESVLNSIAASPGLLLATGHVAHAKITVDPAYGRWSTATGTIVAS